MSVPFPLYCRAIESVDVASLSPSSTDGVTVCRDAQTVDSFHIRSRYIGVEDIVGRLRCIKRQRELSR